MKIYTEVNYIWKDNKLVQTDSKSFDYEGEVDLCHWYHRHSTTVSVPSVTPKITLPKIKIPSLNEVKDKIPTINEVKDIVSKGPTGGFPKKFADTLYGGSTKDAVTSVQNTYQDFEKGIGNVKKQIFNAIGGGNVLGQITTTASGLLDTDDDDDNKLSGSIYGRGASTASTEAGGYKKKTKAEQSRKQMNLTSSRKRSILTS